MRESIKDVLEGVEQAYGRLLHGWNLFATLYGTHPRYHEIMNSVAAGFFAETQRRFADSLILDLARLFDPAITGNNDSRTNLTMYAVLDLMRGCIEQGVCDDLKKKLDAVKRGIEPALHARNKRIAHLDRTVMLSENPLEIDITKDQFESALEQIEEILDAFGIEIFGAYHDLSGLGQAGRSSATTLMGNLAPLAEISVEELEESEPMPDPRHTDELMAYLAK